MSRTTLTLQPDTPPAPSELFPRASLLMAVLPNIPTTPEQSREEDSALVSEPSSLLLWQVVDIAPGHLWRSLQVQYQARKQVSNPTFTLLSVNHQQDLMLGKTPDPISVQQKLVRYLLDSIRILSGSRRRPTRSLLSGRTLREARYQLIDRSRLHCNAVSSLRSLLPHSSLIQSLCRTLNRSHD
jgi:hypothetical protein